MKSKTHVGNTKYRNVFQKRRQAFAALGNPCQCLTTLLRWSPWHSGMSIPWPDCSGGWIAGSHCAMMIWKLALCKINLYIYIFIYVYMQLSWQLYTQLYNIWFLYYGVATKLLLTKNLRVYKILLGISQLYLANPFTELWEGSPRPTSFANLFAV